MGRAALEREVGEEQGCVVGEDHVEGGRDVADPEALSAADLLHPIDKCGHHGPGIDKPSKASLCTGAEVEQQISILDLGRC